MTRYIAFSLYGTNPKYTAGALQNAEDVEKYFPGWKAVFYCGEDVPNEIIQGLNSLGATTFPVAGATGYASAAWRFEACFLADAEVVIFRDADSRFSHREAWAVSDWLSSGKSLHVMRDHPNHKWEIQAGMFGILPSRVPRFLNALAKETFQFYYGNDQDFLRRSLYYPYRLQCLIHDDFAIRFLGIRRFGFPRAGGEFIGEIVDELGEVDLQARQELAAFSKSLCYRLAWRFSTLRFRFLGVLSDLFRRVIRKLKVSRV